MNDAAHSARVDRFQEIYDATYPRIMAYTHRRARDREDALDAVSETFTVVWRRLDDVPADERAVPWVYGVARRVLANQYRSLGRRAQLVHRVRDDLSSERADLSFDAVHTALDALKDVDREILTLSAWDDLDNGEIAEVLGTSPKNVAVRLHRARKRLGRQLAVVGVRPPKINLGAVKSEEGYRTPNEVNGTHQGPGEVETP